MLFFAVQAKDGLELRKGRKMVQWESGEVLHVLLLSMKRKNRIPGKETHLTIIILSCLLCRGWLAAKIYR